jgi:integrase
MARISKRIVDAARAGTKPAFVWDSTLPGFGLLILPTGKKSFVFQYRTAEGRTRRATVAKVGSVTPDQARALADGMSRLVKSGGDPLEDKAKARAAVTVGQLLDDYLASGRFAEKAPSTRLTDTGRIERHLRPLLGGRHVGKLQPEEIRRVFASIRDGKTATQVKTPRGLARVAGGEGTARKAIRLLRAIFAWGIAERMIDHNPAAGIAVGGDGEREAVLDAPDYARLFATLATMETQRRVRPAVADAIRIIALTGARKGEICGLRWQHVDLKRGVIVLPAKAHKTGRKTGKPRVISLPATAQQILARQAEGAPDGFVFSRATGDGPVLLTKPWLAVRAEAELPAGFGLHGLRHSLATLLAVGGAQAPEIMTTLGHRQLSTTARYINFADKSRAALAERAAAPALAGMAAAEGAPAADVISLSDGRRKP